MESVSSVRGMIPISMQRRSDLYSVLDRCSSALKCALSFHPYLERAKGDGRVNTSYRLEEKKVVDTIKVEDLGAKTVLCRCWQSKKFPLCDGWFLI